MPSTTSTIPGKTKAAMAKDHSGYNTPRGTRGDDSATIMTGDFGDDDRPTSEHEADYTSLPYFEEIQSEYVGRRPSTDPRGPFKAHTFDKVKVGKDVRIFFCFPNNDFRGFVLKTKQCPSVEMLQANPIHPETLDWIRGPPIDFMKVLSDMVTLQECCEGLLNHKSKKLLTLDADISRALIRTFVGDADLVEEIEEINSSFIRLADALPVIDVPASSESGLPASTGPDAELQQLRRDINFQLEHVIKPTSQRLLKKTNKLIQRASHIMSIDEAAKSREQGASMKRLTWITFIFLPLLFVSGLFGMNIDILDKMPSWKWYFIFLGPVMVVITAVFIFLKWNEWFYKPEDEENQLHSEERKQQNLLEAGLISAAGIGYTAEVTRILTKMTRAQRSSAAVNLALHVAVEKEYPDIIQDLVTFGIVDFKARNDRKLTALQVALEKGNFKMMKQLLHLGADPRELKVLRTNTPRRFSAHLPFHINEHGTLEWDHGVGDMAKDDLTFHSRAVWTYRCHRMVYHWRRVIGR